MQPELTFERFLSASSPVIFSTCSASELLAAVLKVFGCAEGSPNGLKVLPSSSV